MVGSEKAAQGPGVSERWDRQVVVITGASSGIGAALAEVFAARGAEVVLAARRQDRLAEAAQACTGDPMMVACDVTRAEDRTRLVDATMARHGRIDVLVNNAGIGLYAPFERTQEADLRAVFEVDFFAAFLLSQAVVPTMRAAGHGAIVNVASTGGLVAHTAGVAAYLAAKHAVVGMSRGLRRDLDGTNITVQVVCPHLTDTDFFGAGIGAEEMRPMAEALRGKMDSSRDVALGTVAQVGSGPFLVFPTPRAEAAFSRFREA